jgi:hypothetical protein
MQSARSLTKSDSIASKTVEQLIALYGSDLSALLKRLSELQRMLAEGRDRWEDRIGRKKVADRAIVDREVAVHLEKLRQIEGKTVTSQAAETGDRKRDADLAVAVRWAQIREVEARKEGLIKVHERKMAEMNEKFAQEMRMLEEARDSELQPIVNEIAELQTLIARLQASG